MARRLGLTAHPLGRRLLVAAYERYKRVTEAGPLALARRTLRTGDLAVDIGANVGFYTLRFSRFVGDAGAVVAFEPEARTCALLRGRLTLARARNVELREVALGSEAGSGELHLGAFPGDNRTYAHTSAVAKQPVRRTTLDDELAGRAPRLVKIDVQGAEVEVLAGMPRTLAASPPPLVVVELWPAGLRAAGHDPGDLFATFAAHGYGPATISRWGRLVPTTAGHVLARCGARGYADVAFVRRSDAYPEAASANAAGSIGRR